MYGTIKIYVYVLYDWNLHDSHKMHKTLCDIVLLKFISCLGACR